MDFERVKKFISLFVMAFGLFVLIFIAYSMIVINKMAQKKGTYQMQKDYAGERVSPSPTFIPGQTR